ncbi:MAG: hypothetical protein NZ873_01145 [Crenarchaeota archaeon]|nr:hypothetical protein [Thermoproteota archaeon]MDW8033469.1 hypothetical protein [Nitrososphaerota archaeon]
MGMLRMLTAIVCVLLAYSPVITESKITEYSFSGISILEGDLFIVALNPPVENIQVYVNTSGGKGYSYALLTNRSLAIPEVIGYSSTLQLISKDQIVNVTIVFSSKNVTRVIYGVLTSNNTYYRQASTKSYFFAEGILFIFSPQVTMPPGESRITFNINTAIIRREEGFRIQLPPLVTVIPVLAGILLIVYLNAYAIIDSYYLSQREELSTGRKIALAILLFLSAVIIYWLTGLIIRF